MSGGRRNVVIAVAVIATAMLMVNVFNVPVRDYGGRVLDPLGVRLNQWTETARTAVADVWGGDSAEQRQLRAERTQLRLQLAEMERLRQENEQLRSELNFVGERGFTTQQADVIIYQSGAGRDKLRINVGADDGVEAGMPVVADSVVVGAIEEVSARNSEVLLVTDTDFRALAIADADAEGIVRGGVGSSIRIEQLPPDATLEEGDTVVTSGRDGNYPRGLLIGTVRSVGDDTDQVFGSAQLAPEISYRQLQVVSVLLDI